MRWCRSLSLCVSGLELVKSWGLCSGVMRWRLHFAVDGWCSNDKQVSGNKHSKTRSIQRTQTPPRLWSLPLTCDFDLMSRSRKLMSLDVTYCTRYDVCECNSLQDMTIGLLFVTFDLRLWPSSSVKVTFIFIIRWTLYCCLSVPSTKFVQ